MTPTDPQSPPPLPERFASATDETPAAREPKVGDFIGRYRIRERIGEGGMGLVFAAEDPELGRVVALKLLRSVKGPSAEEHRHRLLREAQALARVSHRNLVMVFDVGTHEDRVWIAMEHVLGDTLDDWLAARRRTWTEIVDVFIEAGRGLVAVHEAGLVHRDFKPGNVIVRGDGMVQVLDFGLAAEDGEELDLDGRGEVRARPALDALGATLTQTGGLMGTPAYMAPEQFLRQGADARSDQFSFCVALFEALYGYRPFDGEDLAAQMMATVEGLKEPPPELPGIPDLLRRTLERGLQSDPDDRFPDLEAVVFALKRARQPAEPQPASGDWRRFVLGMVAGGAVLAAIGGLWVASTDDEDPPQPEPPVQTAADQPVAEEPPEILIFEEDPQPAVEGLSPDAIEPSPDESAKKRGRSKDDAEERENKRRRRKAKASTDDDGGERKDDARGRTSPKKTEPSQPEPTEPKSGDPKPKEPAPTETPPKVQKPKSQSGAVVPEPSEPKPDSAEPSQPEQPQPEPSQPESPEPDAAGTNASSTSP